MDKDQKIILKNELKKEKEKFKNEFNEFKKFAFKGNIIDLSIGVIIGTAFAKIVSSFSNDIIMPFISLITNNINFNNMFIALDGVKYETIESAKIAGASILYYGNFLTTITDFLLTALCIFIAIRQINKFSFKKKNETEKKEEETTKECPYCKTRIHLDASRCPNCTSELNK